jgi:hypothetical protein
MVRGWLAEGEMHAEGQTYHIPEDDRRARAAARRAYAFSRFLVRAAALGAVAAGAWALVKAF